VDLVGDFFPRQYAGTITENSAEAVLKGREKSDSYAATESGDRAQLTETSANKVG
jgi:hypothetical protein